jgi:PII-like signaling protein
MKFPEKMDERMKSQPGKLLSVYVNEHDKRNGKPVYEAIVSRCQEMKLAGLTVFRCLEGFGETAELHKAHLLGHDRPMVITIVETAANTARALPALQEIMASGVIAVSDVEITVILNGKASGLSE